MSNITFIIMVIEIGAEPLKRLPDMVRSAHSSDNARQGCHAVRLHHKCRTVCPWQAADLRRCSAFSTAMTYASTPMPACLVAATTVGPSDSAPSDLLTSSSPLGYHYSRWPAWIRPCTEHGIIRFMSRKGCSLDNPAASTISKKTSAAPTSVDGDVNQGDFHAAVVIEVRVLMNHGFQFARGDHSSCRRPDLAHLGTLHRSEHCF